MIKLNVSFKPTLRFGSLLLFIFFWLYSEMLEAQIASIRGVITNDSNQVVSGVLIGLKNTSYTSISDRNGQYILSNIPYGDYILYTSLKSKKTIERTIHIKGNVVINLKLQDTILEYSEVEIVANESDNFGKTKLKGVENFGIYEGKKTEVIEINSLTANLATNNARQVYAQITGLNIWETDQAGLQLGVGGRGLSPNRTSSFNVRQNGYDISADALGYPESYYTPPVEALERIELVRGAASLQYGTQFGGMLNFKFKKGPKDKKFELTTRQSVGSWGFLGSFNSIGGQVGKLNYYIYYQHKQGDGYRANSGFNYHNFYSSLEYRFSAKTSITLDLTKMQYLAQQAGGLTDRLFNENPRQSLRTRNWFKVDWNLAAIHLTHRFNENTQVNLKVFGLIAERLAIGNLERINVADFGRERTLIEGKFRNIGAEARMLHWYKIGKQDQTLLTGIRLYSGSTTAKQGFGSNGSDANFQFLNPNDVEDSDYKFPNRNYSFFAENIFNLSSKFSITPGFRLENIQTFAQGYYKQYVFDGAGNIIVNNRFQEENNRVRTFMLFGIGSSYKANKSLELYANLSQNYRAINFSDLRINNPNLRIDPNIKDENGYTADLGMRGRIRKLINYELTFFYIRYFDKIGQVLRIDPVLFNDFRFRTNIADARNYGVESFIQWSVLETMGYKGEKWKLIVFQNSAFIDARYIKTQDNSINNKKVEMVPPYNLKFGSTLKYKQWSTSIQYTRLGEHFSDASNSIRTASAVEGVIPSYNITDFSIRYQRKLLSIEASINNLFDNQYFTRRADGYPGPGIIPADGRGYYCTVQLKF